MYITYVYPYNVPKNKENYEDATRNITLQISRWQSEG